MRNPIKKSLKPQNRWDWTLLSAGFISILLLFKVTVLDMGNWGLFVGLMGLACLSTYIVALFFVRVRTKLIWSRWGHWFI